MCRNIPSSYRWLEMRSTFWCHIKETTKCLVCYKCSNSVNVTELTDWPEKVKKECRRGGGQEAATDFDCEQNTFLSCAHTEKQSVTEEEQCHVESYGLSQGKHRKWQFFFSSALVPFLLLTLSDPSSVFLLVLGLRPMSLKRVARREQRHKLGLKHSLLSLCLSVNSCWYLPTTSFTSPLLIYFILITSTYCLRFAYPPPLVPAILLSPQPSINPPSLTPLTFPECDETQVLIAVHRSHKEMSWGLEWELVKLQKAFNRDDRW